MKDGDVNKIKIGSRLIYNDSRSGHTKATCDVLSVIDSGMVVQFSDRADTNFIAFSDSAWMKHLSLCER